MVDDEWNDADVRRDERVCNEMISCLVLKRRGADQANSIKGIHSRDNAAMSLCFTSRGNLLLLLDEG